jgi:DNA primase
MIDFIHLLKDKDIPYKLEVENWIQIHCPICRHEGSRGYKGGINLIGGYYHCWACNGTSIEKVFSELLQVSFYEAKKILQDYETDTVIRSKLNRKVSKGKSIELPGVEIENKDMAYSYLSKRNFNPIYIIQNYRITYGSILGDYSFRIIIPIYHKNILVSFQARSIYSKEKCKELDILRYKNYPIELGLVNIKHILYNLDNCNDDWLVVVEGVFDCWRLGPKNIAATMGTSMSDQQINLLSKRFRKVIFLFDNEKPAQLRAKKYGEQLSALGVEVEIFNPEFEHDPGDYTETETKQVKEWLGL